MSAGEVILDGSNILTEADFHHAMSESLGFCPYYGKNLDALWDYLSSDVERPVKIIWLDSESSKKSLGKCFDKIIHIFEKTKQQDLKFNWDEKFNYILK